MPETRKTFHEELRDLKAEIIELGGLVVKSFELALRSIVENDISLVEIVRQNDDAIDRMTIEVEEKGMAILARQAPVARDLRLVYSILFIGIHLERMGDLSLNIAQVAKHVSELHESSSTFLKIIKEMGALTLGVVKASLEAFDKKDVDLALKLPSMDEPIDGMFKDFFKELAKTSTEEYSLDWSTSMILVSRYLERIADHAVDIGERVSYFVTGEMKEFES
jgi:phosphate transport system protein